MAPLSLSVCILRCLGTGKTNALAVAVAVSWEAPKVQRTAGAKGAGLRLLRVQVVCMYRNGNGRPGDGKTRNWLK